MFILNRRIETDPFSFLNDFRVILQGELPGEDAHSIMSPANRPAVQNLSERGIIPRESAVMILIYPRHTEKGSSWYMVLIKRNEYEGAHSAQVSFPGGRKDEKDSTPLQTAIRETYEELGIQVPEDNVLGALSRIYIPPSNFIVSPFIAYQLTVPEFIPDRREVNYIIEFPLFNILDEELVKNTQVKISTGFHMKVPYFDIGNEIVWGATAIILSELKELLKKYVQK
jgi:8-oxo-dGTP pyrophosphatase MutT (NUDIX family)